MFVAEHNQVEDVQEELEVEYNHEEQDLHRHERGEGGSWCVNFQLSPKEDKACDTESYSNHEVYQTDEDGLVWLLDVNIEWASELVEVEHIIDSD